jgi:hypothetical protein
VCDEGKLWTPKRVFRVELICVKYSVCPVGKKTVCSQACVERQGKLLDMERVFIWKESCKIESVCPSGKKTVED